MITYEVITCNLECESPQSHYTTCATIDWIVDEFIRDFRNNPMSFKASVTDNANKYFGLIVPRHRVYKAKKKAKVMINGIHKE